ncbi:MAG TPA: PBP1A family penicillin-binding protein [Longimicrobiales bacterium]|nr:PBP1A family penicillin-binding protein [Longimicrobiales bacterium]
MRNRSKKQTRSGARKRPAAKRWLKLRAGLVLTAALVATLGAGLGLFAAPRALDCPSVEGLRTYRAPEASRVFAQDGSVLTDLSPQRRVVVDEKAIPPALKNGFVAVEDRRFWEHGGIDLRGIGRAIVHDIAAGSFKEGFSTITMQLSRSLFPEDLPSSQKSLRRKACEVYLAGKIEREFTKRQILGLYLNQIYLGSGLYGVEMASEYYFGKPVAQLTPAETALIIGLNKNPEGYNPRKNPMRAIERRNTVLAIMAREKVLPAANAQRAMREPLRLAPPPEAAGPAPYFVAEVRRELRERFGPNADVSGLRVYTGLDPQLQQAAYKALVAQIQAIEAGKYGKYRHPVMPKSAGADPSAGGSPYLQGMVVALDPETGAVRALVGGRDFSHSAYDRAIQARRQPGSAFKPIVYATAIQDAGLTPTTQIQLASAAAYNPDDEVAPGTVALTARQALTKSSNAAAVRVGAMVGPQAVARTAKALGISTPIPPYPSIYLGAAEVVPVELVGAFAAFDNGGFRVQPHLITRVEDKAGKVLWQPPAVRERALDEGTAFITLSMMEDVVDHGTGASVRSQGFWLPAAGKTGTTNDAKDVWFVGMTKDLVAGVWLGFDRPQTITASALGGGLAAPIWGQMMKEEYRTRPAPGSWAPPAGVVSVAVDAETGLLATANCPPEAVRIEYYLPGTEPHDFCPLHPEGGPGRFVGRLWQGLKHVF